MDNIIKQGYLKKAHPTSPCSSGGNLATSIKQLFEPQRWYVFGMKMGIPFLEYYDKEESAFSGEPIHSFCMATCKRITYTLGRLNKIWTFCVFLDDRILELTAESRESMLSWCRILERTLHAFGNLRKTHNEHIYSEYPIKRPPRKSQPLTPPDTPPPEGAEASGNTPGIIDIQEGNDEAIFESQTSLMNTLRNSGNLQNEKAGFRESIILAASSSDDGAKKLNPATEDDDMEGDQEYSDAAWTKDLTSPLDEHEIIFDKDQEDTVIKPNGRSDDSSSEPENTGDGDEDFVGGDFWVSNKKLVEAPVVPRRNPASFHGGIRDDFLIQKPQPRRPSRPHTGIFDSSVYENEKDSKNCLTNAIDLSHLQDPVPPPRRKHSLQNSKSSDPQVESQYSFVRKDRKCEKPQTATEEDNYELAGEIGLEEENDQPSEHYPYFAMSDSVRRKTVTEKAPDIQDLDDGYQCIRSSEDDQNANLLDYEYMSKQKLTVNLSSDTDVVEKHRSVSAGSTSSDTDLNTPTNRDSSNFFDSSMKSAENTYAPFPVQVSGFDSAINPDEIPALPPHRNIEKDLNPVKPPRHKKSPAHSSPKHSSKISGNSDVLEPVPPSVESIPVHKQSQGHEQYSPKNVYNNLPSKNKEQEKTSFNFMPQSHVPDNPEKRNPSDIIPRKRNVPPLTDYAYVTPKTNPEHPKLPPPRKPVSQNEHSKLKWSGSDIGQFDEARRNSPTFDSFQFRVGISEPGDDSGKESNDDEYENPTVNGDAPPLPPPRISRPSLNKSKSCQTAKKTAMVSQDDLPPRPKSSVYRQQSLQERQRINPTIGAISVVPLKQSQAELLQQEQRHPCIAVKINRAWGTKIGLVDLYDKVWVAGWDMKTCPRLTDRIHIGDQLIKINDRTVRSSSEAQKIYKVAEETVTLMVQRLPYAMVIAIHRQEDKQPVGIQREGGTAKIVYVDPNGLAARHGLPQKARSVEVGSEFCYWYLTEINSRPLDLTYKGSEIEHLLNAVGKDISIVVQPEDFVKELKKQLKKLKNFKDFLMR